MNHSFNPSLTNAKLCSVCQQNMGQHGDYAICECCPKIGPVNMYMGMAMCPECIEKEKAAQLELKNTAEQRVADSRAREDAQLAAHKQVEESAPVLSIGSLIDESRQLDAQITVRADLFNAATVAIEDLRTAIWADESIPAEKKQFTFASLLKDRITNFKKVIFDKNQELVELQNMQRAQQTYLNTLANQLRKEEREKLQLADISYQPTAVKPAPSGTRKPRTPKLDMAEVNKYAKEFGMPPNVFVMACNTRKMTPEQLANVMRKAIAESNSEFETK